MKKIYHLSQFKTAATALQAMLTPRSLSIFFIMLMAFVAPSLVFAQAPTLSYSSPQTYTPNTVITPLTPTSSGVAAPAYGKTLTTINTGISSPYGVAVDRAGNLYVSDVTNAIVKEFPAGGGSPVVIGTGQFSHPEGIAVDASGNVFAAGDYDGTVTEILKADGSKVGLGTGFNEFSGVAVDATGNVFVADFSSNNALKEILKSNGGTVAIGSGLSDYVLAVAVDAAGNVYATDNNSGIKEVLASNGSTISFGTGVNSPQGIAVDATGNLFVTDQGAIKEIPAGGGAAITLVSGLKNPGQIAVDGSGNIYFVDTTNGTVQELKPVGGYYISALPLGLAFNSSTGIISGTAPAQNPPTNYIVTAYNSSGSASAIVNITVGTPPVPTLTYQGPKTFTTGLSINQVAPVSTGVGAPGYNSTASTAGTGYNQDVSVAIDAAGNVYVADKYNTAIKKIPVGGGTQVTIATGYTGQGFYGIAIDPAGNFYLSDQAGNAVFKLPAGGGSLTQIGTGFNSPGGLAADAAGNVYVADIGNNAIKKILASNGSISTIATGLGYGYSVALDAAGNIYVAATYNNAVVKIPAGGGSPVNIGSGFSTPQGVAVDAVGNVYVSDYDSKSVKLITASTGATSTLASGFTANGGLAVDGAGNAYVADPGKSSVFKVSPNGGYYINTTLPQGLTFNGVTGVISGTPTTVSPATNYTITGYNASGSARSSINLSIVAPTTINSITLSSPTITNGYYAQYNVVFGAAVTGLLPSNFSVITTGGLTSANVNYISGSGANYSVGVFTGGGEGTIKLAMNNSNGVEPGISTTLPFIGPGFTVDRTAPTATTTSFTSNNANNQVAIAGNTVTLAFTTSETVQTPTVTIAGHSVTPVNSSGNNWTANYTMTSSDQAGLIAFSVLLTDLAGNTTTVTSTSTGSTLTFDSTVPSITSSTFTSNNTFNSKEARVGSIITLAFKTSEAIKTPTVTIAGHSVTATNAGNDNINWSASYTMTSSNAEGPLDFTAAFSSVDGIAASGGAAYDVANTGSAAIIFDKTAPTVTAITLESPVTSPTGSGTLTYEVTFSEAVTNVTPSSFLLTATGATSGAIYQTTAGLTPNIVNVSVQNVTGPGAARLDIKSPPNGIVDLAGNALASGFTTGQVYTIFAIPTAVTSAATFVSASGATLNGSVNDNDADTKVNFVYGTDPNLATGTIATPATTGGSINAGAGQTSVSLTLAGLAASKTYYYRVSAANTAGTGLGSILSFTTTTPATAPLATTIAPATAVSSSGATISGSVNAGGSATTVSFIYGTSSNLTGGTKTTATTLGSLGAVASGTASLTLSGLSPSTAYYYQVSATNGIGTTKGTIVSFTTLSATSGPTTLSYGGPKIYTVGTAIATLSPTGNAAANTGYNSTIHTLAAGYQTPYSTAVDAAGNIYVADITANTVSKIPAGGGAPVIIGSGFSSPGAVAVDGAGNVYVADAGNYQLKKIPAAGGAPIVIASNIADPLGIAVDAAGNVFATSYAWGVITKTPAAGGATVVVGSGFDHPIGIAVDAADNIYVAESQLSAIKKIPAGGGPVVFITNYFYYPTGVAVDNAGNIYVSDYGNKSVMEIAAGTSGPKTINSGFKNPFGLCIDGAGNIYVTDVGTKTVSKISPSGGYFITPALPAGLNFTASNGKISGIPTAVSPATNYTITAYNGSSSGTANLNITVTTGTTPLNALFQPGENTPLISTLNTEKVEANNILSPNGDGINDIWVVKNIANYPNNSVAVYDRAGRLVFAKRNYQNDWAGTYNGSILNGGTYYYLVDLGNGSSVKGFITVVRE